MNNTQSSIEMLTTLNDAALAIAEGLSLPRTLQRIADTARALVGTQYAALGVLGDHPSELKQFITSGMEPQRARHVRHEPEGHGLLGAIFTENKPIVVDHIQSDPRSAGFCEGHPIMTTFLGVPITNRGKRLGNLYLCDKLDESAFNAMDAEMVALLAAHAAIAIENARLHEELKAVALRAERDRIGMELHDGVIQSIYAAGMKLEIISAKVEGESHAQVQQIMQDLNNIIDDIRAYIRNLISAHEEQTTLRQKVENLVTHFQDFSGVKGRVDIGDGLPILSDYQRHNMLQILRELLANIARHAGATEAHIAIRFEEREMVLVVQDNGRGFEREDAGLTVSGHFGLRNVEQRARRLVGQIQTETELSKGTTVTLRFPAGFDHGTQ